jgi:hypothetical protein
LPTASITARSQPRNSALTLTARAVSPAAMPVVDPLQLLGPIRRSHSPIENHQVYLGPLKLATRLPRRGRQRRIQARPKLLAGARPTPPTHRIRISAHA